MKITMEQLMKLIGKLETKAEDMYRDEDGYSFIVTTTKCLYKIDVIMDRGEFMNISIVDIGRIQFVKILILVDNIYAVRGSKYDIACFIFRDTSDRKGLESGFISEEFEFALIHHGRSVVV